MAAGRIVDAYRSRGGQADAVVEIADAAALGETMALEAFGSVGADLGVVCASLVNALNPAVIVIAGGVAGAFEWIAPAIRAAIAARAFEVPAARARVVRSALGPDAGVVGAALWAARKTVGAAA